MKLLGDIGEFGSNPWRTVLVVLVPGFLLGLLISFSLWFCLVAIVLLVFAMTTTSEHEKILIRILQALFISLPFISVSINVQSRYGIQLSFVMAALLIVVSGLRRIVSVNKESSSERDWISIALAGFVAMAIISVFMTMDLSVKEMSGEFRWLRSVKQIISLGMAVSLFLAVRIGCRSREMFRSCIAMHMVVGTIVALFGHYEWVSNLLNLNLPLDKFHGFNPSIINNPELMRESVNWVLGLPRVGSVLVEPGFFGAYLVTVLPFFVAGAIYREYLFTRSRTAFYFCGVVVLLAILLTLSRSPYFGMLASLMTLAVLASRVRPGRVLSGVLLLMVVNSSAFLFLSTMGRSQFWIYAIERFTMVQGGNYDLSVAERLSSLITSFNMFLANPLLGVGLGNFGFHYATYAPIEEQEALYRIGLDHIFQYPASIYGQVIAETGLLGTLLFAVLMFLAIGYGLQAVIRVQGSEHQMIALGLVTATAGFMVSMMSFSGFHTIPIFWPFLGLIAAQARLLGSVNLPKRRMRRSQQPEEM